MLPNTLTLADSTSVLTYTKQNIGRYMQNESTLDDPTYLDVTNKIRSVGGASTFTLRLWRARSVPVNTANNFTTQGGKPGRISQSVGDSIASVTITVEAPFGQAGEGFYSEAEVLDLFLQLSSFATSGANAHAFLRGHR